MLLAYLNLALVLDAAQRGALGGAAAVAAAGTYVGWRGTGTWAVVALVMPMGVPVAGAVVVWRGGWAAVPGAVLCGLVLACNACMAVLRWQWCRTQHDPRRPRPPQPSLEHTLTAPPHRAPVLSGASASSRSPSPADRS